MEPHSAQTGWHCIHQATRGLNKGSCCRLPTGYQTQWNPELRSRCDELPGGNALSVMHFLPNLLALGVDGV